MQKKRKLLLSITAISILSISSVNIFAEEFVHTDRYTLAIVDASDDQKLPLKTIVTLSFGVDIKTVGDAITELLQGSGYQWVANTGIQSDQILQTLTLPAIARTLGPVRLDQALTTIAGSAWLMHVDKLHRTVTFEVVDVHQPIASR